MGRKFSPEEYFFLRKRILNRLYFSKAYCAGHMLFERLQRTVEAHMRGFVRGVLGDLVKEGLVVVYGKTMRGEAYQLNIKRLDEISKFLEVSNKGLK